jgi:hypothetical protein
MPRTCRREASNGLSLANIKATSMPYVLPAVWHAEIVGSPTRQELSSSPRAAFHSAKICTQVGRNVIKGMMPGQARAGWGMRS